MEIPWCMMHVRSYHLWLILFSALEHHPAPPPYNSITSNAWDAPKYSTLSSSPNNSSQRFNLPQCELFSRDDFAISSSVQSNPAFQPDQPIGNKRLTGYRVVLSCLLTCLHLWKCCCIDLCVLINFCHVIHESYGQWWARRFMSNILKGRLIVFSV